MLDTFARWWGQARARLTRADADDAVERQAGDLDLVEQARRELMSARALFESVSDPELIDHAIHRMTAAERRYMFLLKEARRSGLDEAGLREAVARQTGTFNV